jgi:hypothetical protein
MYTLLGYQGANLKRIIIILLSSSFFIIINRLVAVFLFVGISSLLLFGRFTLVDLLERAKFLYVKAVTHLYPKNI